jgi:hypothetical protein
MRESHSNLSILVVGSENPKQNVDIHLAMNL